MARDHLEGLGMDWKVILEYIFEKGMERHGLDCVALEQVFLQVLPFFSSSVLSPLLHTHLHLNVTLTEGRAGKACESSKKQCCFGNGGVLVMNLGEIHPVMSLHFKKYHYFLSPSITICL